MSMTFANTYAEQAGRRLARDVRAGVPFALTPYVAPTHFVSNDPQYAAATVVLDELHTEWKAQVIRYYAREMINESLNHF